MLVFEEFILARAGLYDGTTEEGGEHGDGADGEIVLSAEPFGDFTGFLAEGIGKLLLGEASLLHEVFYLGCYSKGEVYLGGDVLRDIGEHLLELIVDGFHECKSTKNISFISEIWWALT